MWFPSSQGTQLGKGCCCRKMFINFPATQTLNNFTEIVITLSLLPQTS